MAVKQDCPVCGRKGNEGHICKAEDDNLFIGLGAAVGGLFGAVFGGPVGAVAGAAGGGKLYKIICERDQRDSDGYVNYRFNCMNPNCKHTWTSKIKE